MKKRIISLILVLALCLSLLPTVFAADDTTTTVLDGTKGIVIDENTVNGTTWSDGNGGTAKWHDYNHLTLTNYHVDTGSTSAITFNQGGGFVVLSGSSSLRSTSSNGVINAQSSSVNISGKTGATLTVTGASGAPAVSNFNYGTFRVKSGSVTLESDTGVAFNDPRTYGDTTEKPWTSDLDVSNSGVLTIKGKAGDIADVYVSDSGKVFVYGEAGGFKNIYAAVAGSTSIDTPEANITGTVDLTTNPYQVDGKTAQSLLFTKAFSYILTPADGSASTSYASLKEALTYAKTLGDCTITIDNTAPNQLSLADGIYADTTGTITLDLNGHSVGGYSINVGGSSHSGKLKIVDSSNGNGAIGLTVREGGDVEFYGGVATTCLQLQVYGGSVKFYGGHIHYSKLTWDLHNDIKATDFLPNGYAYYIYSGYGSSLGSIVELSEVDSKIASGKHLAAAKCHHGSYDENEKCVYCGLDPSIGSAAKLTTSTGAVTYYSDYVSARSAAQSSAGSTLTLLKDAALESSESNHTSGTYTIDLNGNTLSSSLVFAEGSKANIALVNRANDKATVTSNSYVAQLDGTSTNPTLTIGEKGSANNLELISTGSNIAVLLEKGTLEVYGGSIINTSYNSGYMDGSAITLQSRNATVTLHDGTFTGSKAGVKITSGTLTIEGGTFSTSHDGYGLYFDDSTSTSTVTCTLTGGTFHKIYSSKPLTSLLGDKVAFAADADGKIIIDATAVTPDDSGAYILNGTVYVVPHEHNFKTESGKCACGAPCPHDNVDTDTGICKDCNKQVYVARVTGSGEPSYHKTLGEAISAAQSNSGSTVQLLADVTLTDSIILSGNVTLDLNGKTLSASALSNDLLFTGQADAQTLTLINTAKGKLATVEAASVIDLTPSDTLTIGRDTSADSSIRFDLSGALFTSDDLTGCSVNIYGSVITTTADYAIDTNIRSDKDNPFQLLIFDGIFTGAKAGVRIFGDDIKPTITGGTFNTSSTELHGSADASGLVVYSTATNFISGGTYQGIYSYTTNLCDLLKSGYDFKKDGEWLAPIVSPSTSWTVTVAEAPIKNLTIKVNDVETSGPYIAYIGQSYTFSAETEPTADTVKWYSVTSAGKQELTNPYKPTAEGPFTLLCEATKDGYTLSKSFNVVVSKKIDAPLTVEQDGWEYGEYVKNGNTAPTPTYTATDGSSIDGGSVTITYAKQGTDTFSTDVPTDAGQYTVKVTVETATTIYTGKADFEITPKPVKVTGITVYNKTYDGTTNALVGNYGTLDGKITGDSLLYSIKAEFADKNAGASKTVNLTVTLDESVSRDNYTLSAETQTTATATISKRVISIENADVTPKVYDGTADAANCITGISFSNLVDGEELSTLDYTVSASFNSSNVDEANQITATVTLKDNLNYTFKDGSLSAQFVKNSLINKAFASCTAPKPQTLRYNGTEQSLVAAGTTADGTMQYSLNGTDWQETIPTGKDAKTYTVWYKVAGDGNHNDTAAQSVDVTIDPAAVTVTAENKSSRVGQPIKALTYTCEPALFGSDAFTGALASDAKSDTVGTSPITQGTLELSSNYELTFVQGTYTVEDKLPQSDFKFPQSEVNKTYGDGKFILTAINAASGSNVTYSCTPSSVATVDETTGEVTIHGAGTATITATATETADYKSATATYELHVSRKSVDIPAADPTEFVYNGKDQTYTIAEDPLYRVSDNVRKNAGTQNVLVTLTDSANYVWSDGTDTAQTYEFTIAQAEVIVTALGKKAFVGDKAPDLSAPVLDTDYTVEGLIGEDTLGGTIALSYAETPDMTKAGAVQIDASGADGGQNYTVRYVSGTLTIEVRPATVKGYPIEVGKTENGTVTVTPKDAGTGNTVTVKTDPDDGYELGALTVTDENGKQLPLTDEGDGKYSFIMPSGKVRIEARFVRETSPFRDVFTDDYYYEAVKWASAAGITGGIGNGLFDPHGSCTRAQIVTFLWRAEGSPEPSRMSRFADVPADAYYAKAVAWAVENGITTGTTDTTFSPNASCTRAQAVTFLWRTAGSPEPEQMSTFTDVSADAYYAKAVAWAVENGITTGTGNGKFSPDATCTRAQIVTFLWRAEKKAKQ